MTKLIRNTSIYAIGNILPQAANLVLLPLYTRYLSPRDYGIVNSMQVLASIFVIFFTLAIERSIYRLYYDYKTESEKKHFLGAITLTIYGLSIIVLIVAFLSQNLISHIYKSISFYPFYFYSILYAFFSIFALVPKIYYQVNERATKFITISISQFILNTVFIIYFIVIQKEGAVGMLKGLMISNIILAFVFIIINMRMISFAYDFKIIKESLKFSLPMIPILLSSWVMNMSDRIFVERYFSMYEVGLYSLAYKIGGILMIIGGAIFMAYNPLFYKLASSADQIAAKKKISNYNTKLILIVTFLLMLISLFSKEFIFIFLNKRYLTAYQIVPIIAVAVYMNQIGNLFNLSIYQEKKTNTVMALVLVSSVLILILNFMLIPKYGITGAAVSAIISFTLLNIAKYYLSKRYYFIKIYWKEISIDIISMFLIIILFNLSGLSLLIGFISKVAIVISASYYLVNKHFSNYNFRVLFK